MSKANEKRSGSPQQSVDQLATEANGRRILPDQSAQPAQEACTCCMGRGTKFMYFNKDLLEVPCPKCKRAAYEAVRIAAVSTTRDIDRAD